MSSLARVNWLAQQRVDLHHLLAMESYTAFDFRSIISVFTGAKPFVLRGFEVVGKTGLAITVSVADSLTFNPLDGNGSFYKGLSDDADVILDLPAEQENLFVQLKFKNETKNPINTAYWDPLALTGEDVAGTEYSASANNQVVISVTISVNTVGFDDDAVPLSRVSTDGSNVTKMIDCRPMLFRLGSGGTTPDGSHKFPWGTSRKEAQPTGTGVGDAVDSPFRSKDQSGIVNDKGIKSLKEWADAVMTRISEIAGSSLWYATDSSPNDPLYGYITGLDIQRIFLDSTAGHSIQPSDSVSLKWDRNISNALVLKSNGPIGYLLPPYSPTDNCASTVKWQANYSPVQWELGGDFVSNSPGGSRAYKASANSLDPNLTGVNFVSAAPVDKGNIYLLLSRDVAPPLASGNPVRWAYATPPLGLIPERTVFGVVSDFTGIAVGDWIRKASEGFSQYYRVVQITDATTVRNTVGDIADSMTVALELDRDIKSGVSTEPMLYFRSRYCNSDVTVDLVDNKYNYRDSNYYWLGRRVGETLILRGYGNMQEGEETLVLEDSFLGGGRSGGSAGASDMMFEHSLGASYDVTNGYTNRITAPDEFTPLLKIRRRKRDNTVLTPGPTSNANASLEYTIETLVGTMNIGDGLWVRLSDTTSGVLINGSVTDVADDSENTDVIANRWEVRSPARNPLRSFDNKDVYLIARRIVTPDDLNGLMFVDGTVMLDSMPGTYDPFGTVINNYFEVTGKLRTLDDVYLTPKTPKSILFIDQYPDANGPGRIDEDNANFNYNKATQELNLFNNIFGVNYLDLEIRADQYWFRNLGSHSLYLGGALSNIVIPGNLTVLGSETITSVNNIAVADKNIQLGIGNGLYGGGGSGMSVADNTLDWQSAPNAVISFTTVAGRKYVDVAFTTDPLYVADQKVGVASNFQLDQITEADQSMTYTVVATATIPGDVERRSATVWRFFTNGVALAGGVFPASAVNNWQVFDVLSEVHLASSGGDPAFMTSWSFGVKRNPNSVEPSNEGTVHAIVTPYESASLANDFKTIPTARQSKFDRRRLPFAWSDGKGPATITDVYDGTHASDTTFDFTDRLTWDDTDFVLRVHGTLKMKGHVLPDDRDENNDNLWDLGSIGKRWHTVHAGPGSFVSHNDDSNTNWSKLGFSSTDAELASDAATPFLWRVGTQKQFTLYTTGGRAAYANQTGAAVTDLITFGTLLDTPALAAGTTHNGLVLTMALLGTTQSNQLKIHASLPTGSVTNYSAIRVVDASLVGGATITSQYGLHVESLTAATNNYGLYSALVVGAANWHVYGVGDAWSYLAGNVGIGTATDTAMSGHRLTIGQTSDTLASGGILLGGDVNVYRTSVNTVRTNSNVIVDLTGQFKGTVAIGATVPSSQAALLITTPIGITNASAYGIWVNGLSFASAVTAIDSFVSSPTTATFGSSTTLTRMSGFRAMNFYRGTNALVTSVYGFLCENFGDAGMTNKYGFYSDLALLANSWNFYASGTATNYLAGSLGIGNNNQTDLAAARLVLGTTADTATTAGMNFGTDIPVYRSGTTLLRAGSKLRVDDAVGIGTDPYWGAALMVSATCASVVSPQSFCVRATGRFNIGAIDAISSFFAQTWTAIFATPTTVNRATGYYCESVSAGPNATVTEAAGFWCADSFTGTITNTYGFRSDLASGANRWNFYAAGTATNYLAGSLGIGNLNQTAIDLQRLLLGLSTDTLPAGGMNFGTDTPVYREAAGRLHIASDVITDLSFATGTYVNGNAQFAARATSNFGASRGFYGFFSAITAAATDNIIGFLSSNTTAASGAHTTMTDFRSSGPTMAGTATIGSYFDFYASDIPSANATNAYAFYSLMNVLDAPHPRWNLYVSGSAPNYLQGGLILGDSTYATAIASKLSFATSAVAAGGINFGGGLSNLYRSAADTLKTDGNFIIGGSTTFGSPAIFGGAIHLNYGTVKTASYTVLPADCIIPMNSSVATPIVIANGGSSSLIGMGNISFVSQGFQVTSALPIIMAKVQITVGGNTGGVLGCQITDNSDNVLDTATNTYTIPPSGGGIITFTFAGGFTPLLGTTYRVRVNRNSGSTIGVQWHYQTSGYPWGFKSGIADFSPSSIWFEVDGSGIGAMNMALPAVTTGQKGRLLVFTDVAGYAATNYINLVPNGTNKICNTNASYRMDRNYMSISMVCNGVDGWDII